ncbi:class I SAM-dependent methyltransferase [Gimesia fumaroli]|uniref:Bifunctional 3-demethylubiquinone-9 3-methyltransferase/ 2-octaprenyl-6-hydroxy phenol methylase n=1 Tax=Gimesia fumaroli TaxID=2527976 RepID=A0A518IGF3_9PLAN|nr:class I SAM-dependent methyltransferase [Gimesia fumaroli]QDV52173.1 bifunctional 3-demethylubiquinone-9 3-methyltransferase/ 2-octaprenyl-6-hydroxy phenol methylase [Gimesia fumaroli]
MVIHSLSTNDDLRTFYNTVYETQQEANSESSAHEEILQFIRKHISCQHSLLDASCGRGALLRGLQEAGYQNVTGTEISDAIVAELTSKKDFPIFRFSYDDLEKWNSPEDRFDVVISCNVLDHLANTDMVSRGLKNLQRISKKWLLISIKDGGDDHTSDSLAQETSGDGGLQMIKKNYEDWKSLLNDEMVVEKTFIDDKQKPSIFFFFGKTHKYIWENEHQEFELNFHIGKGGDWRYGDRWMEAKSCLQEYHSLDYSVFKDKKIIDIGSGPRSMCEWFNEAKITCVEPLASQYLNLPKSQLDFDGIEKVFSNPAEEFLPELQNTADFVWSHNCLDHCYSWKKVIDNIYEYLKEGGSFYISTDTEKSSHIGHPGIVSASTFIKYCKDTGLDINYIHMRNSGEPVWIRTLTIKGKKRSDIRGKNHPYEKCSVNLQSSVSCKNNQLIDYSKRKIEELQLFNLETIQKIGSHENIAIVGNGPVSKTCLARINESDIVVRFNDWNRRKNYSSELSGTRCDLLFTHYDINPILGQKSFPIPKCVTIAIPSPFHCDRIIEFTEKWYSTCRISMVNPYINRLICEVLGLNSEGWKHPLPTVGFTFLFNLWIQLRDTDSIKHCYVTGFDWRVDISTKTVERVDVSGSELPEHYNHSYLRESKWVCRNLFTDSRFEFSPLAEKALGFMSNYL